MRKIMPALVVLVAFFLGACGGGSSAQQRSGSSAGSSSQRPSSPAKIKIMAPRNGEVVRGRTVRVRLSLQDARIVRPATQNLNPHKGHVHLFVDGRVVSMNYQLSNTIQVRPGTHTLRAEFVASDHLPWDPRVFDEVAFQVKK